MAVKHPPNQEVSQPFQPLIREDDRAMGQCSCKYSFKSKDCSPLLVRDLLKS